MYVCMYVCIYIYSYILCINNNSQGKQNDLISSIYFYFALKNSKVCIN